MNIKKVINQPIIKDILLMVFFGALSFVFNKLRFFVPGVEGVTTDFKEIPLLVSIFYISNPISLIGVNIIAALEALASGNFWPTFIAHSVSLIISWYFYLFIKKQKISTSVLGIIWLVYIGFYYTVLLAPVFILSNYLLGLNLEVTFVTFYKNIISTARFEIVSTAIITSLYFILYKVRKELKEHKNKLEVKVKERTEELATANEELKVTNDELFSKNTMINEQNIELKSTMQHLEDTQLQLIQTEKMASLGVLTAGVAHEINNPLNYIMGGYVGLQNYFLKTEHDNEQIPILLNSIKTGIDRASNIVKGLNQFSRDNKTYNEDCNIHNILDNCLTMLHNQLKHRIQITKNYCTNKIIVTGNIGKLHQIFINILNNANQAIKKEGQISIATYKSDKDTIIEISDSGCGISKKDLSKITDPFFTTKDPGKGTGLGMTISNKLIQEHKGKLEYESELGNGTKIKIRLPLKQNN